MSVDAGTPGPAALSDHEGPVEEPLSSKEAGFRTAQGETIIEPGVVEKIAHRAASETPAVVELGSGSGLLSGGTSGVSADVQGMSATLDITVKVRYPEPVSQVADAVRARVADRVERYTGLTVSEIDVKVSELVVRQKQAPRPRVQ